MQWVVLIMRLIVGGVFLAAGALKVGHPAALATTIAAMQILPQWCIAPLSLLLPYFEIGLGLYLVVGLFTRASAWVASAQLVIFAGAIASVVARGIVTSCGCFGPADIAPATWLDVGRDLLFLLCTLPIALFGPGAFALDNRMRDAHPPSEGSSRS